MMVDAATGAPADPVVVDRSTAVACSPSPNFQLVAGPAASEATRAKHAARAARLAARSAA